MGGDRGVARLHGVRVGPRRFACVAVRGAGGAAAAAAAPVRMPGGVAAAAGGVPQRSRIVRAALTACARVLPFIRVL